MLSLILVVCRITGWKWILGFYATSPLSMMSAEVNVKAASVTGTVGAIVLQDACCQVVSLESGVTLTEK